MLNDPERISQARKSLQEINTRIDARNMTFEKLVALKAERDDLCVRLAEAQTSNATLLGTIEEMGRIALRNEFPEDHRLMSIAAIALEIQPAEDAPAEEKPEGLAHGVRVRVTAPKTFCGKEGVVLGFQQDRPKAVHVSLDSEPNGSPIGLMFAPDELEILPTKRATAGAEEQAREDG